MIYLKNLNSMDKHRVMFNYDYSNNHLQLLDENCYENHAPLPLLPIITVITGISLGITIYKLNSLVNNQQLSNHFSSRKMLIKYINTICKEDDLFIRNSSNSLSSSVIVNDSIMELLKLKGIDHKYQYYQQILYPVLISELIGAHNKEVLLENQMNYSTDNNFLINIPQTIINCISLVSWIKSKFSKQTEDDIYDYLDIYTEIDIPEECVLDAPNLLEAENDFASLVNNLKHEEEYIRQRKLSESSEGSDSIVINEDIGDDKNKEESNGFWGWIVGY